MLKKNCIYLYNIILHLCFLFCALSCLTDAYANSLKIPLIMHLKYQDLIEKPEKIDSICKFQSEKQKLQMIEKFCSLNKEEQMGTDFLTPFCKFKDNNHAAEIINDYCIFKTPRSKQKILNIFCKLKTNKNKQNYIRYLANIVKVGERLQRPVNYNNEDERLIKRTDALSIAIYHVKQEPHTEAAYHLGVIYGFSDCGMHDINQAINHFVQAHDKPETSFVIAELYRTHQSKNSPRRIYQLYNDAIKAGILEGHYNLAVYIYEQLQSQKTADALPLDFNYKTIFANLREAAKHNAIAQNDLAVLIHTIKPNYNQKKLQSAIWSYLKKSADTGFMPAIYNQIIMLSSQDCTKEIQQQIKQKLDILITQKYPPATYLLTQLKHNKLCFNHKQDI